MHSAIAKLEVAIETVEQQRGALVTRIREGSVAVALSDGSTDDVDLGALREDEAVAIKREAELRRTVGDLRDKLGAVEADLDVASQAHRAAQLDALQRIIYDDVFVQYMDAANAFTAMARRVFALEHILGEASGIQMMLLAPSAARECYVPSLLGAPDEAIYRGRDRDTLTGAWREAINAERDRLAAMGIYL